jgi:Arc/MetJ family transcription regulator
MSRVRTTIEIEDTYVQAIMNRYRVRTKTEAVDLALRHLAGQPMTREEALAMRGANAIAEPPPMLASQRRVIPASAASSNVALRCPAARYQRRWRGRGQDTVSGRWLWDGIRGGPWQPTPMRRTRPFPMRPCGAWLGSLVGCDVDLTLDTVLVDLRAA